MGAHKLKSGSPASRASSGSAETKRARRDATQSENVERTTILNRVGSDSTVQVNRAIVPRTTL